MMDRHIHTATSCVAGVARYMTLCRRVFLLLRRKISSVDIVLRKFIIIIRVYVPSVWSMRMFPDSN